MPETLNVLIPIFLGLFIMSLANILYFKYRRPNTRQNQAIIGLSYAMLCLSFLACIVATSKLMELEQTMSLTLLAPIPAYLSWDYFRSSRLWRKQCS